MSLKTLLHSKIKESGYLSYGDCCQLTVEQEYKVGTMERRLRDLTTKSKGHIPDIEPVFSIGKRRGGKYISGYKIKKTDKIGEMVDEVLKEGAIFRLKEFYQREINKREKPEGLPYFKQSSELTESKTYNPPL